MNTLTLHAPVRWPLAVLAIMLGASLFAAAQSDRREAPQRVSPDARPSARPGGGIDEILNEEQRAQLHEAMAANREHRQELEQKAQKARRAMHEAMFAEEFDEKRIKEAAGAIAEVEAHRAMMQAKAFAKIRQSLTPEQLEKLRQREGPIRQRSGARSEPRPEARSGNTRPREEGRFREQGGERGRAEFRPEARWSPPPENRSRSEPPPFPRDSGRRPGPGDFGERRQGYQRPSQPPRPEFREQMRQERNAPRPEFQHYDGEPRGDEFRPRQRTESPREEAPRHRPQPPDSSGERERGERPAPPSPDGR